jgi:hypothetical protein
VNLVRGRFIVQFLMTCEYRFVASDKIALITDGEYSLLPARYGCVDSPHCLDSEWL